MVHRERIWRDIESLKSITESDIPYTRRAFTKKYLEGRRWIAQELRNIGLTPTFDAMANLRAVFPGDGNSESGVSKRIVFGSHSDTVVGGGPFDGILGIVAGLELLRQVKERHLSPRITLEFIDFLAEETTDWGISCIGSRGLSGNLSEQDLDKKHPHTGESLREAIVRMGGNPARRAEDEAFARENFVSFFELHIEQGPILESIEEILAEQNCGEKRFPIGFVQDLVGIMRREVVVLGHSNHSGTTPMDLRRDALTEAARIILKVEELGKSLAKKGEGHFVATVGKIDNMPNSINVVPGEVHLFVDVRTTNSKLKAEFEMAFLQFLEKDIWLDVETRLITDTAPIKFDADLLEEMIAYCDEDKELFPYMMASGAGHDAAFMAGVTPTMLLFVPSRGGLSHHKDEWTSPDNVVRGVEVFVSSVFKRAGIDLRAL